MYDNIGGKIKGLARISFIVAAIIEVITGIILIAVDNDLYGLLTIFVGPIVTWISSWLTYGFGELIEKVDRIEQNTRGSEKKSNAQAKTYFERISKIEKLRSQGLITEEEYQQAISKE